MVLPYIAPKLMEDYRQKIRVFTKSNPMLECIHAHFFPDRSGFCDLTEAKEQEEIFILKNRAGATMKASPLAMQVIANVVDIENTDHWYQNIKDQRRLHKERLAQEALKREEDRKALSRTVLVRKKGTSNTL